jgi:hypothetical protein
MLVTLIFFFVYFIIALPLKAPADLSSSAASGASSAASGASSAASGASSAASSSSPSPSGGAAQRMM